MADKDISNARVRLWPAIIVSVSVCSTVIGATVGATWKMSQLLNSIRDDNRQTAATVAELAAKLEETKARIFTLPAAAEQALRMAISNPNLKVPDPRNPSIIIQVEK